MQFWYYWQVMLEPGLSHFQRLALLDYLDLALDGQLAGCECIQEGKLSLCEHVLEAKDDPALALILEKQLGGLAWMFDAPWIPIADSTAIDAAVQAIEDDPARFAEFTESYVPPDTSEEEPGTNDKILALRRRVRRGQSTSRRGDNVHNPLRLSFMC